MKLFHSHSYSSAPFLILLSCCTGYNASTKIQVEAFVTPSSKTVQGHRQSTQLHIGGFFNFNKKEPNPDPESEENEASEGYSDDDPVEKLFNVFFGKKEENPMGLSRFGAERFPEQYPATKDEWAEPLESDNKEMAILRPFLKNTNLESRALKLTYDANKDGWDAASFHRAVDKKGGAIVLCVTRMGLICGGYNPKGWVGYGEARGSIAAFLYQVGGSYAENGAPGYKLQKVGGPGLAQMDMPETGPSFGADSLVIPLGEDNSRLARSKLGSYYERFPDGTNSLFGKDANVQLRELKVFHGVYEEGEYIPFTDAEPFALY